MKARLIIFAIGTGALLVGTVLLRAVCNGQGITMWAEPAAGLLVVATSLPLAISRHEKDFDRREILAWIAIGGVLGMLLFPVGSTSRIRPNDPNFHGKVRASNDEVLPYVVGGIEFGVAVAAFAIKPRKPKSTGKAA